MANKVTTVFENDTTGAIKSTDALGASIDGVGSKGKQVADALHAQADQIDADFKASVEAADALAAALGPEMAAKIGQSGIDKFVADLKGAGLTADEIKADVGELSGALQHLDDVGKNITGPKQGLDDVAGAAEHTKGKLGEMRGESDNSRSVLANMVGNSAQDIAGLGGVAGTAGMALGQLGEYATEGNISLSGLAKVAGPMAAITVVTMAITNSLKAAAAVNAFDKAKVDAFTDALKDGKTAADAWDAALTKGSEIEWVDAWGKVNDLLPVLDRAGVSWDEFSTHAKQGGQAFQDWAFAIDTAGDPASKMKLNDLNALLNAGTQFLKDQATAVGLTEAQYRVLGDTEALAAQRTRDYQDQVAQTSDEVQRKVDEMSAKWDELNGKINAEKSMIQYKQQVDDVKAAIAAAGQAEIDYGVGSPEALAAKENARLKTLDLESTTADLGETILGLPAEQVTNLIAQIDRGELDNMPGIIQATLDSHTYRIKAHLDSIVIDGETHAAGATSITVNGRSNVIRAAEGGYFPARPGGYMVNLAEGGEDEYVIPKGQMGVGVGGGIQVLMQVYGSVTTETDLAVTLTNAIIDLVRRGVIPPGAFN